MIWIKNRTFERERRIRVVRGWTSADRARKYDKICQLRRDAKLTANGTNTHREPESVAIGSAVQIYGSDARFSFVTVLARSYDTASAFDLIGARAQAVMPGQYMLPHGGMRISPISLVRMAKLAGPAFALDPSGRERIFPGDWMNMPIIRDGGLSQVVTET